MRPSREERREQLATEREVWRLPLLIAAVVSTLLAVAAALQQWWAPAITLSVIGLANGALHLYFRKPTRWER